MNVGFSRVLVTGGAGFIGSHIVDRLSKEGIEVGILDNFKTGSWANIGQGKNLCLHQGDIANSELVASVVKDYDAVIHQAALVGNDSPTDLSEIHRSNVAGTINLLKAAHDSGVQRFVYASSAAVYGETNILPAREDSVLNPRSPYGFSKLEGEKYCQFFRETYGMRTVSLRYFNVYGPRQRPGHYGGVISTFINSLAKGEPPVILGDGSQTRDFVHISDVVEANVLVLNSDPVPADVYNISTGRQMTINQLALYLCKLMGRTNIKPRYASPRRGDIKQSYGDFTKAKEAFGYEPRVALEEGLGELVSSVRRQEQSASPSQPN